MNQNMMDMITKLRHELHRHPELSMQESWTKQHLMEFLQEHTKLEIYDKGRWFYAAYRSPSAEKNIAFRADFDALPIEETPRLVPYISECPGIGHKCGHDGHAAALAGFGLLLDQYGANENVFLLFQHAEETGQGAKECLPFLKEEKIDEIYAVHNLPGVPLGAVAAPKGTAQFASTGMTIHFHGQKSHACYPENGRNPAFAISKLILKLDEIRESGNYQGMTLITVIQVNVGEHAFGTNAGEGELLLTVRGAFEEELRDLIQSISKEAHDLGDRDGLVVTVSYEDEFADCFNHDKETDRVIQAAKARKIPITKLQEPFRASEDFGRYTKEVPGAIFYIGAGEDHPPIHTPDYDFPDEILEIIISMYQEIANRKR